MLFEINTDDQSIKASGDFKLSDMAVAMELLMEFQEDMMFFDNREDRWNDFIEMFNKS